MPRAKTSTNPYNRVWMCKPETPDNASEGGGDDQSCTPGFPAAAPG